VELTKCTITCAYIGAISSLNFLHCAQAKEHIGLTDHDLVEWIQIQADLILQQGLDNVCGILRILVQWHPKAEIALNKIQTKDSHDVVQSRQAVDNGHILYL
jgi:hypothetical protein